SGLPVLQLIERYFPVTLQLCFSAFIISLLVGVPLGALAGLNQGKGVDVAIMGGAFIGYSIPIFWLALLA
ncbi:peptide ABC transporter permease, partial [Aeromonas dhakensis]